METNVKQAYSGLETATIDARLRIILPNNFRAVIKQRNNSCTDVYLEPNAILTDCKQIVVKTIHSSSGRGVVFLTEEFPVAQRQKIEGAILADGAVVVEKMYNRIEDYSLQFYKQEEGVSFIGITKLLVNSRGDYMGNELHTKYPDSHVEFIEQFAVDYCKFFSDCKYLKDYFGPIGVDTFLFEENGEVFYHPAVEVNYRHTMGYVAKMLERFVLDGCNAIFKVRKVDDTLRQSCCESRELVNGKIGVGTTILTPIESETQFCATLEVAAKLEKVHLLQISPN